MGNGESWNEFYNRAEYKYKERLKMIFSRRLPVMIETRHTESTELAAISRLITTYRFRFDSVYLQHH